jgi:spermidine/putrescine transport system permease protein
MSIAQASAAPRRQLPRIPVAWLLLAPGLLWLLLFYLVPLYALLATSLFDPSGGIEGGYEMRWHVINYAQAIDQYQAPLLRSFFYASCATFVCLLLGYPLAYTIAFHAGRWRNLMLLLVVAPFFTSFLVRTLAWQLIFADHGPVLGALRTLHLLGPGDRLLATPAAVISGLSYNFLPFMVLPLYASLEKIDPRLIEAAGDLYASPWRGFLAVTLPLSMPGLVAGTLLTFIPTAGDYINAQLLGNTETRMLGNVILDLFLMVADYPAAAALSMSLMIVTLMLVLLYLRLASQEPPA